jgi:hypothetical protein
MTVNLCGQAKQGQKWREALCPGAAVLRSLALTNGDARDN